MGVHALVAPILRTFYSLIGKIMSIMMIVKKGYCMKIAFDWTKFLGSFLTEEFDQLLMQFCSPMEQKSYYLNMLKFSANRGVKFWERTLCEAFYTYYDLLEECLGE